MNGQQVNSVKGLLKENLPPIFHDQKFINELEESSKRWLIALLSSLSKIEENNEYSSFLKSDARSKEL